jgi:hypothetical protein
MKKVLAFVAVVGVITVLIGCSGVQKKGPPKTAEGAVKAVVEGLQQNKPVVLWDALPASYQKDVDELVHTAAGKVDPGLWNAVWDLFGKLVTVAKTKKDMILKSPMMAESKKAVKMDELSKNWDVVVDLLDTMAKCDLSKIEKAKTISMGDVLATTGADFMAKAQKLSQVMPPEKMQDNPWVMLKTVKVTPVKTEGNTATLKIEGGGQPAEEFKFVKVEGKWIPMELEALWTREITKAKKQVAEMKKADPKETEQAVAMIKAFNNGLQTVIDSKTQEQFNVGISQLMGPIMGLITGGGQTPPGGGQTPPPGGGLQPVPPPAPNK